MKALYLYSEIATVNYNKLFPLPKSHVSETIPGDNFKLWSWGGAANRIGS